MINKYKLRLKPLTYPPKEHFIGGGNRNIDTYDLLKTASLNILVQCLGKVDNIMKIIDAIELSLVSSLSSLSIMVQEVADKHLLIFKGITYLMMMMMSNRFGQNKITFSHLFIIHI